MILPCDPRRRAALNAVVFDTRTRVVNIGAVGKSPSGGRVGLFEFAARRAAFKPVRNGSSAMTQFDKNALTRRDALRRGLTAVAASGAFFAAPRGAFAED